MTAVIFLTSKFFPRLVSDVYFLIINAHLRWENISKNFIELNITFSVAWHSRQMHFICFVFFYRRGCDPESDGVSDLNEIRRDLQFLAHDRLTSAA